MPRFPSDMDKARAYSEKQKAERVRLRKVRPSDAEFERLKAERDAAMASVVETICAEQGWNPKEIKVHARGSHGCYCACPEGPCQHLWNGPEYVSDDGCMSSITCSLCGLPVIYHDMRCGP